MAERHEPDRSSRESYQSHERERLQNTAVELARWQGVTESQIRENSRRLDAINGSIESIERSMSAIEIGLATIRTKIAIWSAIGGLIAGGVVTAVIGAGFGQ